VHGERIPEERWEAKGGLLFAPAAIAQGFAHGFTTRETGDVKGEAAARETILRWTGARALRFLHQIHSTRLLPPDEPGERPDGDGWVGKPPPGLLLAVMGADCLPLLLFHRPSGRVAAVHAGWRGATAGIAASAAREMAVPPEEITAALGPAIGPCCYEVGEEVARAAARHPETLTPRDGGKYLFDLPAFVAADLESAGLTPERIAASGWCTRCHPERFFSHRRAGGPGRMAGFVGAGEGAP